MRAKFLISCFLVFLFQIKLNFQLSIFLRQFSFIFFFFLFFGFQWLILIIVHMFATRSVKMCLRTINCYVESTQCLWSDDTCMKIDLMYWNTDFFLDFSESDCNLKSDSTTVDQYIFLKTSGYFWKL